MSYPTVSPPGRIREQLAIGAKSLNYSMSRVAKPDDYVKKINAFNV